MADDAKRLSTKVPPKDAPSPAEVEQQLERALENTFPASDPVAVGHPTSTEPRRPAERRPPLIDKELVNQIAATLEERDQRKSRRRRK